MGGRPNSGVILVRLHLSFTSQTELISKTGTLQISNPRLNKAKTFSVLTAEAKMSCLSP